MIGVIADDLTGAAELGAVGLRHGLQAEIVLDGQPDGEADLVCLDTDSRAQTPEEAARRTASAAKMLHKAGARWIYKKVDSVLRGQVTAELEAAMHQLHFKGALLAPANPSLGRTIQDGKYFIRGKPINKTEFARDPQFPRHSAQVIDLLKKPQIFPICVNRLDDAPVKTGIVIGEAATAGDVQQWAARRNPEMLPAGGAEFFGALLAADAMARPVSSPNGHFPAEVAECELFVCGTSSVSARKFITAARHDKVPVFSLPAEMAWGAEWQPAIAKIISERVAAALGSYSRVILAVGLPQVRDALVSARLSDYVVQVAANVLRRTEVGHVFSEGGATSAALVRQMGWRRLKVLRELAPGVATLAVENKKNLLLTIKPGSYAWPAK